jgi:hypothetical protein
VAGAGLVIDAPVHQGRAALAAQPLRHPEDIFAFPNETLWSYRRDPVTGSQVHERRDPPPDYHLRCFVLARSVKQFHAHARFEAGAGRLGEEGYRRLVREVVSRSPRRTSGRDERVVIPGYADLRGFSADWVALCRAELGGAWQSYVQRGHWRMVLPFTRGARRREAGRLFAAVRAHVAPVVHVFTFPALTINHALVAFDVREEGSRLRFATYDPNTPGEVVELGFDGDTARFDLPATLYFIGGEVEAYEVYSGWLR